jgi:hypothetical protein
MSQASRVHTLNPPAERDDYAGENLNGVLRIDLN